MKIMNTEEYIREMKRDLMKHVNDIVYAEKHNLLNELKDKVWNHYRQIDHALDRNFRFIITEGHVNCKRYRYKDYQDARHRMFAKAEILSWFMTQLCQQDK